MFGSTVGEIVREENARQPRDGGPEGEGLDLEAEHGLAGHGGHHLVLADRAEHATERRAAHVLEDGVDEGDHDQYEAEVDEVVVPCEARVERARDPGDAVGAAREPGLVQKEQAQRRRASTPFCWRQTSRTCGPGGSCSAGCG